MERRKVQLTGGSTFIVSLPKKWVDHQELSPGQPLDVHYEMDGPVTVHPVRSKASPTRRIDVGVELDDHPMHTVRRVISAYLAGFETITIKADRRIPVEHKQSIRSLAQTLIGIEIVEETAAKIVLQDLLDPVDFDIQKALDRMHQLSKAMVHDALDAFRNNDRDLAEDVVARDPEVDRLDWMIKKQFHLIASSSRLAGQIGITTTHAHHHLLVSHALERIADHATRLAEIVLDDHSDTIGEAAREGAVAYGTKMVDYLDAAILAFHQADAKSGNITIELCKASKGEVRGLFALTQDDAGSQIDFALAVESLERIRNYTMDIAEAAIDHVVTRPLASSRVATK